MQCTIDAPAKINLCLHVVGKRPNGYHELDMVMVPLQLVDRLVVEVGGVPCGDFVHEDIALSALQAGDIEVDQRNLCYRAAAAMRSAARRDDAISITLTKCIPAGGGLGGGSSDAAAVLKALNQLWELDWSPAQLAEIGVELGADVPFFCYAGPARVQGIGEIVEEYQSFPSAHYLVVNPGIHVATQGVFQALDFQLTADKPGAIPPALRCYEDLVKILHNDLEASVFAKFPQIAALKERLVSAGADAALMAGSGASVFGVFRSSEACLAAATLLQQDYDFVVATQSQ